MGWLAEARRGGKGREAATKDGGESRKDDKAGAENWARVVDLVQMAFWEGVMYHNPPIKAIIP